VHVPARIVLAMHVETTAPAIDEPLRTATRTPRHHDSFFVGFAIAAAVTVFVGFARTYYLNRLFPTPPFPSLFHVHGVLFTAWMLLLLIQVALVASRRTALHRRVGAIGRLLVAPMLVTGVLVAIAAARGQAPISAAVKRGDLTMVDAGFPPLQAMVIPLATLLLFTMFAAAGLIYRRHPDTHKRFMALATIAMLPPAIGRATITLFGVANPALFFGITGLFVVAIVIYDHKSRGRVHPVTVWGGLALMLSFPGRLALGKTALWMSFAAWLIN
jgi:hypothetical protein